MRSNNVTDRTCDTSMQKVIFYTEDQCELCEEALTYLTTLQSDYEFQIEIRQIQAKEEWVEMYHLLVPVIEIDGRQLHANKISFENIDNFLQKYCPKTNRV